MNESSDNFCDRALRWLPGGSNGEYGIPEGRAGDRPRCRLPSLGYRRPRIPRHDHGVGQRSSVMPTRKCSRQPTRPLRGAPISPPSRDRWWNWRNASLISARAWSELVRCQRHRGDDALPAHGTGGDRAAKDFEIRGRVPRAHPEGIASLVGNDPPEWPQSDPSGTGAPWVERDVLVAPYNDLAATEQILDDHGADLAAVIVEPLHRCIPPVDGFLQGLRDAVSRHGIVLVFDEVVTGFRLIGPRRCTGVLACRPTSSPTARGWAAASRSAPTEGGRKSWRP